DFLVIPGASVDIECLFSAHCHVRADTHRSLKASTITEAAHFFFFDYNLYTTEGGHRCGYRQVSTVDWVHPGSNT
ncbi:uncharacterized protein LAESUDRAFT_655058, partial [Laetiporus sulphureus 93-53]